MNVSRYVQIDSDQITIQDEHGEIATWIQSEWEEDPSIVPAIANHVAMAISGRTKELRELIKHPGERNNFDYRRVGDTIEILKPVVFWGDVIPAGTVGEIRTLAVGSFGVKLRYKNAKGFWIDAVVNFTWEGEDDIYSRTPNLNDF